MGSSSSFASPLLIPESSAGDKAVVVSHLTYYIATDMAIAEHSWCCTPFQFFLQQHGKRLQFSHWTVFRGMQSSRQAIEKTRKKVEGKRRLTVTTWRWRLMTAASAAT
jgi:hypothetical protein